MRQKRLKNVLAAFSAGFLNGLLGTGGGVPLWFSAARKEDKKAAFATSSGGVLLLSLFTLFLSREEAAPLREEYLIVLWLAILGGTMGVLLLEKISPALIRTVFAFLLIGAGILSLIRTVSHVFPS